MDEPKWPGPWVRALLGTAILAVLEPGPLHGYGIAVALAERGLGRPKGGSLYPLLGALEGDGSVVASWVQGEKGPGRKAYELTDQGHDRLDEERRSWGTLVASLNDPRTERTNR